MNTDKQRIYNGDWKTLHPYSGSAPTDLYYITLANKVLAAIRAVETSLDESDYRKIDETEQKELACILTAYFEDIISQTGIFQAFTRIHGKRFGKPLPFYTLDEDYTPGEINIEEVQFLVWHYHMQLNNLDIPYSPTLDTFAAIASDVMEIFETEYESAPENEKLLQYFRIDEKESHNLYALHARFLWLCTQSYLFFNNGFLLEDQAESLAEEAKEAGMDEQIPDMVNLLCNDFGFNHVTEFMQLTPPRWLAEVLGEVPLCMPPCRVWDTNTPAISVTKTPMRQSPVPPHSDRPDYRSDQPLAGRAAPQYERPVSHFTYRIHSMERRMVAFRTDQQLRR